MDMTYLAILSVALFLGYLRGIKDMRDIKEGKAEGIIRNDKGQTTYVFYDDVGLGD